MSTNQNKSIILLLLAVIAGVMACNKIEVVEKNMVVPNSRWQYDFKPGFSFNISDTASYYNLFVVLRHTDAYRYNNIWLNIGTQGPADTMRYQRVELQLGNDARGWDGTGMDDIWELRKPITRAPFKFNKAGEYQFFITQVMRENPLSHIMNVGVRIEKVH